jgi:hypothetical protein
MSPEKPVPSTISGQAPSAMLRAGPTRFIGLDVHKHYLIAIGVDAELNQVLGPQWTLNSTRCWALSGCS